MVYKHRILHITLWVQSIYYFLTVAWALTDINSFMALTGTKSDVWLVKTVSVLLIAISFSFIGYLFTKINPCPVIILAVGCCLFLAAIDFYYAGKGIISNVYFIDGVVQLILLSAWIINLKRMIMNLNKIR